MESRRSQADGFSIPGRRRAGPFPNRYGECPMNTKLFVLAAAAVLALSACKNETPAAQQEAAEASAAADQAGAAAADAVQATGEMVEQGAEAAAAATGEAVSEVAGNTQEAAADMTEAGEQAADETQEAEEHTSELQSRENLVCRLLLEKKKNAQISEISLGLITTVLPVYQRGRELAEQH